MATALGSCPADEARLTPDGENAYASIHRCGRCGGHVLVPARERRSQLLTEFHRQETWQVAPTVLPCPACPTNMLAARADPGGIAMCGNCAAIWAPPAIKSFQSFNVSCTCGAFREVDTGREGAKAEAGAGLLDFLAGLL